MILQGSAVTQTVLGGLFKLQISYSVPKKLWKSVDSSAGYDIRSVKLSRLQRNY